jgi:hypothetical protein
MWVSGLGMEAYRIANDLETDQIPSSTLTDPRAPVAQAGVIAMGLVISGCIVLAVFLLSKVTKWLVAFTAGFFLALDPFYIANSQMIHVDAFLATFMLVSVISWLVFLKNNQQAYLIISGIFGGLAFLTKSPSYYLLPFVGLVALIQVVTDENWFTTGSPSNRTLQSGIWRTMFNLGTWAAISAVTFFILWPAMWVEPAKILTQVFDAAFHHAETPHPQAQFFAGNILREDPGFLFYVATLAWQTTAVTLIGALATLYFLIKNRKSKEDLRLWWYVLLFAGGFVIMMTLGAKKGDRYILPAFVAIDVLAAWGIVEVSELIAQKVRLPKILWRSKLLVVVALFVQAIMVLRHQPYFGTHYNQLLGGSLLAQHILPLGLQGEGMDLAVDFLNSIPGADRIRVATQSGVWHIFREKFIGDRVTLSDDPHFVMFYINYMQRSQLDGKLREVWETCQQEGPAWSASFDGVPYIWICPTYPRNPDEYAIEQKRYVKIGDHITMLGYDLSPKMVKAGETLTVTVYWKSDGQLPVDNHVFVHLTNQEDEPVAQHDGVPDQGQRPTWSWLEGEIIKDVHTLEVPGTIKEGLYTLSLGMYDYGTLERLPAVDANGERLLDDRIELKGVPIISSEATIRSIALITSD